VDEPRSSRGTEPAVLSPEIVLGNVSRRRSPEATAADGASHWRRCCRRSSSPRKLARGLSKWILEPDPTPAVDLE